MSKLHETLQQLAEHAVSLLPPEPSAEQNALIYSAVRHANRVADASFTVAITCRDLPFTIGEALDDRETFTALLAGEKEGGEQLLQDMKSMAHAAGQMAAVIAAPCSATTPEGTETMSDLNATLRQLTDHYAASLPADPSAEQKALLQSAHDQLRMLFVADISARQARELIEDIGPLLEDREELVATLTGAKRGRNLLLNGLSDLVDAAEGMACFITAG